jgi:hypothetical protein
MGRSAALAAAVAAGAGACRGASLAYGPDLASAKANADGLLSAFEQRYTNVLRTRKFAEARLRIARYALIPSRIENDTAVWTGRSGSSGATRELNVEAVMSGGRFTFTARSTVAPPAHVGDSRHMIRLSPLGEDEYQWATDVEHNVGAIPATRATDVFTSWIASAERPASAVRADYRSAFPRTSAALGRLFVLDSVSTLTQSDGSTLVTMQIFLDANRLRASHAAMAKYVDKYVSSSRYRFRLTDQAGGEWLDARADRGDRIVLRFRSHNGALQPIAGVARAMPDTLQVNVDAYAKLLIFTVGVSALQGTFVHIKSPNERGWLMRFQKEPEYHLPLAAATLLKSPLRRPFQGSGVLFRIGLRAGGANGSTTLYRKLDVAVQESAIMRFIGNLGFTAMSDYSGGVEAEENRFLQEMFVAMRADVRALGSM